MKLLTFPKTNEYDWIYYLDYRFFPDYKSCNRNMAHQCSYRKKINRNRTDCTYQLGWYDFLLFLWSFPNGSLVEPQFLISRKKTSYLAIKDHQDTI